MATGMDIEISSQVLRQRAGNMRTAVGFMKDALETANNVMSRTSESFESSAADAFRDQYNQLKSKFDKFYDAMKEYADFLEATANTYDDTDQTIAKAAQDLL